MIRRLSIAVAAAVLAGAAGAGSAAASVGQESMLQDDTRLVFPSSQAQLDSDLDQLRYLGVDRIRVSVYWNQVERRGEARLQEYDRLVAGAQARGIDVNLDLTGPAPPESNDRPNAAAFGDFVRRVAARYPSVHFWSVWNEPNQRYFLTPQYVRGYETSPRIYRALADAAWYALRDTGHGRDRLVIGDTAPKGDSSRGAAGNMRPLRFIRALYCVDSRHRVLRGTTARRLGCPTSRQVRTFRAQHPALFYSAGYAHHPYSILTAPPVRSRAADDVGSADLGKLGSTLSRIFSRYGVRRYFPIWNTEFGYQSGPSSYFGVSESTQAAYINQAEFMMYTNPRVRSYDQFLLYDDANYQNFQSGLLDAGGRIKPAYAAYRVPIFLPSTRRRRGGSFRVWGGARPAPNGSVQRVLVQFRPRGGRWRTIRTVRTRNYANYVDTRVRLTRSGQVRLYWNGSRSRAVGVRIG